MKKNNIFSSFKLSLLGLGSALFLTACSSDRDLYNIVWRKLTWASYLSGEDIKESCNAEAGDKYRYLYNANRADTVLAFSWEGGVDKSSVIELDRLSRILNDLTFSWDKKGDFVNPVKSKIIPSKEELSLLKTDVAADFKAKSLGKAGALHSAEHFLTISRCEDGEFSFAIFNQDLMQQQYPHALSRLMALVPDDQEKPVLPETAALRNAVDLYELSNEENFAHYAINFDGVDVSIGRTYLRKD